MDLVLDILIDAAGDTLGLVPFLFATYLALEALEHAAGEWVNGLVRRAGAAGPVVGALLGLVPQCGFSAMAATLYGGRVITLGTLLAVFLSTSDEMLPLLVAGRVPAAEVALILGIKVVVAMAAGLAADAALRAVRSNARVHAAVRRGVFGAEAGRGALIDELAEAGAGADRIHELCEREHCGCDEDEASTGAPHGRAHGAHGHEHVHGGAHGHGGAAHIVRSALTHTVQVTVFIFLVTLALVAAFELGGEEALAALLSGNEVVAVFAAALVGIVPNCAASVVITQLYLEGVLALAPAMAGLLISAGTGFLVLFRTNASLRENVAIVAVLYAVSVAAGLVLLLLGL